MRDFRDAKTMAQTLRDSLTAKTVTISHSESLELVSKMFGVADWNTLSAMLKSDRPDNGVAAARRLEGSASYPAIPMRDVVPFPSMIFPLFVGREKTMRALDHAFARQRELVLAVQKDSAVDEPGLDDLYDVGVLARLLELERLPDSTMKVLVEVHRRVAISRFVGETGAFQADVADISEGPIPEAPQLIKRAVERFRSYATGRNIAVRQTWPPLESIRDPGRVADVVAQHLNLPILHKQRLLSTLDPLARLEMIDALLQNAAEPSSEMTATLRRAIGYAVQRRNPYATLEHLLLALTEDKDAAAVMRACNVDLGDLGESLGRYIDEVLKEPLIPGATTQPSPAFFRTTQKAELQARELGRSVVTGADYLVVLFTESRSPAVRLLSQQHMTRNDALDFIVRGTVKPR
jgi:ATP-dependent Lon protease